MAQARVQGVIGFQSGQSIHFNHLVIRKLFNYFIFDKDQRLHSLVFGIIGHVLLSFLAHLPWMLIHCINLIPPLEKCTSALPYLETVFKSIYNGHRFYRRPISFLSFSLPLLLPPFLPPSLPSLLSSYSLYQHRNCNLDQKKEEIYSGIWSIFSHDKILFNT